MARSKAGDKDYEWSSTLIDELRKAGFRPSQIKNILPNLLVESGWGRADAVEGDWKKSFEGDKGNDYRGRGYVQLTGKLNYENMSRLLKLPLVENPKLAADPVNSAKIAAMYLKDRAEEYGYDYETFESVYKALAPKNKNPETRLAEIQKYGYRLATDDDVRFNMPAYDPSAWTVQKDGSLMPNSTPNSR